MRGRHFYYGTQSGINMLLILDVNESRLLFANVVKRLVFVISTSHLLCREEKT